MPSDLDQAQARLNRARDKQRRQKLGPPLRVDDASLDVLSVVYPADMPAVESFIRDAAGEQGAAMVRATPEGPDRRPPGRA